MDEVTIIGFDLAKNVFQLHGAAADGRLVFRKKLTRPQFQMFMATHPPCTVTVEACPGSHYWAREMAKPGHTVKVISPQCVTPYVKRQKNDAADAEAIAEAATRPHMRFVEPKSAEQQARAVMSRVRQKVIAQRIELINAPRSHLYEFGFIAPVGLQHLPEPVAVLEDETSDLPLPAWIACRGILRQIESLGHETPGSMPKSPSCRRKAAGPEYCRPCLGSATICGQSGCALHKMLRIGTLLCHVVRDAALRPHAAVWRQIPLSG